MADNNDECLLNIQTIGNGSVVSTPKKGYQYKGCLVTLKAIANSGAKFIRWQGDVAGSHHICNIRIKTPITVVAVFASSQAAPENEIIKKPQSLISSLTLMAKKHYLSLIIHPLIEII